MTGRMRAPKRVLFRGPLTEYGPGFDAHLEQLGSMPFSAEHQLRLLAHPSHWMEERRLGVEQLTAAGVEEFLGERRATRSALYSRRAIRRPWSSPPDWECCRSKSRHAHARRTGGRCVRAASLV